MIKRHALQHCRSLPMSVTGKGFPSRAQHSLAQRMGKFGFRHSINYWQKPEVDLDPDRQQWPAPARHITWRSTAARPPPDLLRHIRKRRPWRGAAQSRPNLPPLQNRPVPDQHAALFTADSNNQDVLKLLLCCKVSLNWLLHPDLLANFLLCHQRPYLIQQECALVQARVVTDPRPACVP